MTSGLVAARPFRPVKRGVKRTHKGRAASPRGCRRHRTLLLAAAASLGHFEHHRQHAIEAPLSLAGKAYDYGATNLRGWDHIMNI